MLVYVAPPHHPPAQPIVRPTENHWPSACSQSQGFIAVVKPGQRMKLRPGLYILELPDGRPLIWCNRIPRDVVPKDAL